MTKAYYVENLLLDEGSPHSYWVRNEAGQIVARLTLAAGRFHAVTGDLSNVARSEYRDDYPGTDLLGAVRHYVDPAGLYWLQLNGYAETVANSALSVTG